MGASERSDLCIGIPIEREEALKKKVDLYIINRENVSWIVGYGPWQFDRIVIDELSIFKSNKAERFKSLKNVRPKVQRVIKY